MDWIKVIQSGLKAGIITLTAIIASVAAGALLYSQGYKPEGALQEVIMMYIIIPLFAGSAGALNNWVKHRNDK